VPHDPHPKRRRFQWSLRTLFAAFAVVACWLVYHVNWIQTRREDREWLKSRQAAIYEQPYGESTLHGATIWPPLTQHFSWSLWILRESPAIVIDSPPMADSDLERLRRVFPEATVHVGVNGFFSPL
jgi:hypothetical protein